MRSPRIHSTRFLAPLTLLSIVLSPLLILPTPVVGQIYPPSYPSNELTYTIYPSGIVGVEQQVSYPPPSYYPKNIDIVRRLGIIERWNGTHLRDESSYYYGYYGSSDLYIGRNSSLLWTVDYFYNQTSYTYESPHYNHTVLVSGPENFTLTAYSYDCCYGNSSTPPPAKHQFNIAGTYTYQTEADTSDPHEASLAKRVHVIAGEEYELPTINLHLGLTRQPDGAELVATYSATLTPFQRAQLPPPYNSTDSFSLDGSYANGQHTGTLSLHFPSGVQYYYYNLPITDFVLPFTANRTVTTLTGSVAVTFDSALVGTPFENQTAFQSFYEESYGNSSWIDDLKQDVNASTHGKIQLDTFSFPPPNYNDDQGASLTFTIVLHGDVLKYLLFGYYHFSSVFDEVYDEIVALWRDASYVATYTKSSGTIVFQLTSNLEPDFNQRLNKIKTLILNASRTEPPYPQWVFLDSTELYISEVTLDETINPTAQTYTVNVLAIGPPRTEASQAFVMPQLFEFTGYSYYPVNFTLQGGIDRGQGIRIGVPPDLPQPDMTTTFTATWINFHNFTQLSRVYFYRVTGVATLDPGSLLLSEAIILCFAVLMLRRRVPVKHLT